MSYSRVERQFIGNFLDIENDHCCSDLVSGIVRHRHRHRYTPAYGPQRQTKCSDVVAAGTSRTAERRGKSGPRRAHPFAHPRSGRVCVRAAAPSAGTLQVLILKPRTGNGRPRNRDWTARRRGDLSGCMPYRWTAAPRRHPVRKNPRRPSDKHARPRPVEDKLGRRRGAAVARRSLRRLPCPPSRRP